MSVVSRLQDDATQRDAEIHTLRADLKQARQDHQALERKIRELTSAETSTKVCLQLVQTFHLAKAPLVQARVIDSTAGTRES